MFPRGANSFFLGQTPHQKGVVMQSRKQEVIKIDTLLKSEIYQVYHFPLSLIM